MSKLCFLLKWVGRAENEIYQTYDVGMHEIYILEMSGIQSRHAFALPIASLI